MLKPTIDRQKHNVKPQATVLSHFLAYIPLTLLIATCSLLIVWGFPPAPFNG